MPPKRENVWRKRLEDAIIGTWGASKVEVLKMHVGAMDSAGVPDLFVAVRGLGGVWLELKYVEVDGVFDWSKQPTLLQKDRLRRLYYAGQNVGVVVFFEEFWTSIHGAQCIKAFEFGRWDSGSQMWPNHYAHGEGHFYSGLLNEDRLKSLVFG